MTAIYLLNRVRVRLVDHKCKVNSDEFDKELLYARVRFIYV
jgi:hypothetical protein